MLIIVDIYGSNGIWIESSTDSVRYLHLIIGRIIKISLKRYASVTYIVVTNRRDHNLNACHRSCVKGNIDGIQIINHADY